MQIFFRIRFLCLLVCLAGLLVGCQEQPPLKVGFSAALTGRAAGLGTDGRNGFLLAIEEVNAKGGLSGKQVEALVRDNQMDQEVSRKVTRALIDEGVAAIIGPMTSQMALVAEPISRHARVPIIAPTVSTNLLSGQDDYFFRVYYSSAQAADLLAARLGKDDKVRRMAVIYDTVNRAYTEDWLNVFRERFEALGGDIVAALPFELAQDTLFSDIVTQTIETNPDGVLLLANALDTALLCQHFARKSATLERFATGWSYSDDLFHFGGQAVEGLMLLQSADLSAETARYRAFQRSYQQRFQKLPNFPAIHAYDATRLLLAALEQTTPQQNLKKTLLALDNFQGLQTPLSFDAFGDLRKPQLFLARVVDGTFVRIE